MNNIEFDNPTKIVIDLFNRQYDQFDNTIKRLIDANDKAHDQIFNKMEVITNDVHDISSSLKIIINNQEIQSQEVENIKNTLQTLSDRVDIIEEEYTKKRHVWSLGAKALGTIAVILAIVGGLLKLLNVF